MSAADGARHARPTDGAGPLPISRTVSDEAIFAEQVRLLYQSPFSLLANLGVAAMVAFAASETVALPFTGGWFGAMALVVGLRLLLWRNYHRRRPAEQEARRWAHLFTGGLAATALLWGMASILVLLDPSIMLHVLLAIGVAGMVAGAVFSLPMYQPAFFTFIPIALCPQVAMFAVVGDRDHLAIAGMGVVYLLVVCMWGRSLGRSFRDSIRLRLENIALVADLAVARAAAEMANRTKRESLANLSHELRTPLNAIIGFADTLRAELWGPLGHARYRDYAKDIFDSGQHLFVLIGDILDLSRSESGSLELDESDIDLAELAASCRAMMGDMAIDRRVALTVEVADPPPRVHADASKVRQILINLLSNAIKFTPGGGCVLLRIDREAAGRVRIRVSDTGVGISQDDLPRVLEPFVRGTSGTVRNQEGAGLGLALTKRLAERHDAELRIDSQLDKGTVVTLTFPAARSLPSP